MSSFCNFTLRRGALQPIDQEKGRLILINTRIVYTVLATPVTLRAEEDLIEQARLVAKAQGKTLNAAFREWPQSFTRRS